MAAIRRRRACSVLVDTRWRCGVKAATPFLCSFYLFLFYYIFVSYSLSAVGVDDPLLLRGHLISKDSIFLAGVAC